LQLPRKLLVIDANPASGALLVRSIARKFPVALVQHCATVDLALGGLVGRAADAVVIHESKSEAAVRAVGRLRAVNPQLPIIVVSNVDRSTDILQAGATAFVHFDEWLLLGNALARALGAKAAAEPSQA
jgi:DNA-binding NarL/FixJ family response regulator